MYKEGFDYTNKIFSAKNVEDEPKYEALEQIRNAHSALEAKYGEAYFGTMVFGSLGKGYYDEKVSDIDIKIFLSRDVNSLPSPATLKYELNKLLNYDRESAGDLSPPLRFQIVETNEAFIKSEINGGYVLYNHLLFGKIVGNGINKLRHTCIEEVNSLDETNKREYIQKITDAMVKMDIQYQSEGANVRMQRQLQVDNEQLQQLKQERASLWEKRINNFFK